jgi:hypothetical protein
MVIVQVHWCMWSMVSTVDWHRGKIGDSSRPCRLRDAEVGIQPCISLTVLALTKISNDDKYHFNAVWLILFRTAIDIECFFEINERVS